MTSTWNCLVPILEGYRVPVLFGVRSLCVIVDRTDGRCMKGLARANILILVLLLAGSSLVMARSSSSGLHFKGDLPEEMGLFLLVLLVATCVILLAVAILVIAALWRNSRRQVSRDGPPSFPSTTL